MRVSNRVFWAAVFLTGCCIIAPHIDARQAGYVSDSQNGPIRTRDLVGVLKARELNVRTVNVYNNRGIRICTIGPNSSGKGAEMNFGDGVSNIGSPLTLGVNNKQGDAFIEMRGWKGESTSIKDGSISLMSDPKKAGSGGYASRTLDLRVGGKKSPEIGFRVLDRKTVKSTTWTMDGVTRSNARQKN